MCRRHRRFPWAIAADRACLFGQIFDLFRYDVIEDRVDGEIATKRVLMGSPDGLNDKMCDAFESDYACYKGTYNKRDSALLIVDFGPKAVNVDFDAMDGEGRRLQMLGLIGIRLDYANPSDMFALQSTVSLVSPGRVTAEFEPLTFFRYELMIRANSTPAMLSTVISMSLLSKPRI